jgi:hypothetical protein
VISYVRTVSSLRAGRPMFDSREGEGFSYRHRVLADWGPTKSSVQWVLGALSPGVKRQLLKSDYLCRD